MDLRVILLLVLVGPVVSQKLFFKSNREIENTDKVTLNDTVVPCPGNKSACPDGNTCCMLFTRAYGCCSLPMATCCLDGRHCCPRGTKCDLVLKACISGETIVPWIGIENQSTKPEAGIKNVQTAGAPMPVSLDDRLGSVLCPDGAHECQTGQSCCPSPNGFACCSFPDAVCCSDQVHCCPKGTKCDITHSRCLRQNGDVFVNWIERQSSTKMEHMIGNTETNIQAVRCDGSHECPTGNTCCKLGTGEWGCCPSPNAVCCDDHHHCCPHGSTCDTGAGSCKQGDLQIEWFDKKPATTIGPVTCDDTHECMAGTTCCKTADGEWGCCPLPNAECCSDHTHCCPSGYQCSVSTGQCTKGNLQIDWVSKEPALTVENVQCDSTHYCPSGSTCCRLASGQWGCCPVPNAECCSDHTHCCPSGYQCSVSTGQCTKGNLQIDWVSKEPALTVETVQCDSTHYCPSGSTCCRLASGQWGCCPVPNAECCSDHTHCCPSGYQCSVSTGQCTKGNLQIDWVSKEPALTVETVQCDSTHYCPSGSTCCRLASGQWGCCPVPNAECCSDHTHCCPSGYQCSVSTGQCTKGNLQIDWVSKEPALTVETVQCDSTHYCPSGSTCCRLASGQWGCCPVPNAECCSDHTHCCPSGYQCSVSTGKCTKGNLQIDWVSKEPALTVGNVQCDSTHYCPSGSTCCRLASGQWGCCPVPNAECCSDHTHCCPSGYQCSVSTGQCTKGNLQIDWVSKEPALIVETVQCDSTHYCPSGSTCCRLASGQWGCCPVPNAECCSDHTHCCPSGYQCSVSTGQCTKGNLQIDWVSKEPALTVETVQCDSTHYCPSGSTCCRLASGQWGCCPVPNAECCSDHTHCCPSGYQCSVSTGQCTKGNLQIDWVSKEPALTVETVQCDSTHYCPSGSTCCRLASGQWGCCPVPNAECCSDHTHCCPSGYQCSVSTSQCTKGNLQIDWVSKEPALIVGNVQCDSTHYCPSGSTCCRLASGQWGCCPVPNAECCSDHTHCCPSGYQCSVSTGQCTKGNLQIDWVSKEPALTVENVQCDSTHYCPSGSTCCRLASGQWGCCPVPNAECCSDHTHCCPSGYQCSVSTGQCTKGNLQIDWVSKEPALTVENVQCDSTHYCPSGSTCCRLASGQWGCCPVPNAECCSDHTHCCPSGYQCSVSTGQCTKGNLQIDWVSKEPALTVGNVQCDSTHYCPSGSTCCRLASGQWGCCPVPNAECCSDHTHCCPSGYQCSVSTGQCTKGNLQIDWVSKEPALTVETVQCDSTHYCPSGSTCCRLASGQWGCCPVPNAECCSDHTHCCPSGYQCSVSTGQCTKGNLQIDWVSKEPALTVETVQCDSTHYCPSGSTCCRLASGQWGCCPVPNAECCSDHTHCCPSGYQCSVSTGQCTKGNLQIDWVSKEPALTVETVQCDSTHYCPSGSTCCRLASGQWGCCPVPNAECCSDHTHCCPSGYQCSVSTGQCTKGNLQIDWVSKEPALTVETVQCDATHYCPSGSTCCRLASGQWGCCPVPNAECCSDHTHCCPSGYQCSVSTGQCTKGNLQIDWVSKEPALTVETVQCDSTHYCPSGSTCCRLASGQWGCCPVPNAECCSDHTHCCPSGYQCSVSTGQCTKGNLQIDWVSKEPALTVETVQCDATHYCPSGSTCCRLASGQWGCCPVPNAECCSDHTHCCPSGYQCSVSTGQCTKGNLQIDWVSKEPALTVETVQCDSTHYCPSGSTCCRLASGQWGCCPVPNAECCSDHTHCCPSGYQCSVSTGQCTKGNLQIDWVSKEPALIVENVPCDSTHYCPSGSTCCRLASGQWGCCPIPNAVCCSDHTHCCPSGTTCDLSSGKCNHGNILTDWMEKKPANKLGSVRCDETHACHDGNTCCQLSTGSWGCCPLPNAICCDDHSHCCPENTKCDLSTGQCLHGNKQVDWVTMGASMVTETKEKDVICPDGSECQDGQTCCKMSKTEVGTYGCCPTPYAVCCSDGQHCCPHGYKCNLSRGTCDKGYIKTSWFKTLTSVHNNIQDPLQGGQHVDKPKDLSTVNKDLAINTDVTSKDGNVPCAGTSEGCLNGYTCCPNNDFNNKCCPFHKAVCCPDKQHCCPNGYICDEEPGICRIPESSGSASNFLKELYSRQGTPLE